MTEHAPVILDIAGLDAHRGTTAAAWRTRSPAG